MNENTSFVKETDGFFARHFDRKISGAISRFLIQTPITPNQITIGVTLLGVLAGVWMSHPGREPKIVASLLFLLTSVLDGCDGEVARAKKMTSELGGWLDLWGDNVVHIAIFFGLGVGLTRDTGWPVYHTLGWVAAIGTFLSASLASYQTYRKKSNRGESESLFTSVMGDVRSASPSRWQHLLTQAADALARRDFVYGVVVLAFIGKLPWFMWACATGVLIYTFVLILLQVTEKR